MTTETIAIQFGQGPEELPPPRHAEVAQGIALVSRLRDQGDLKGALNLFQRLREIERDSPAVRFLGATLDERAGRLKPAEAAYAAILEAAPRHLPSLVRRAACLAAMRLPLPALDLLEAALALDPGSLPVKRALGRHLLSMRRYRDAAPHLTAVAKAADNPLAQVEIADVLDRAGDPEGAAETYRAALATSPVKAPIHVRLSTLALVRGDRAQARAALDEALGSDPADGYAHLSLATHFPQDADEAKIRAALITAKDRKPHLYAAPLTFALARVLERDGRAAEAFDAFVAANAIMAPLQRPTADIEKTIAARIATFTGAFVASRTSWGNRNQQPVFVFGLPRTGTTLVEQILASHPEVQGLGEAETLPPLVAGLGLEPSRDDVRRAAAAYLAAWPPTAAGKTRVVDKSLSTWTLLGPALLMFPEARFIHVERHPLDTAWSTFTELFPENALPDAYDLKRLAAQAGLYRRTMDAWESAFPGRIVTVRYEKLVADPEHEVRRLLEALALPFDDACLTPHETARTVRTASASQVRRPISASAVGRAQATYGDRLKPLADALQPLIVHYETTA